MPDSAMNYNAVTARKEYLHVQYMSTLSNIRTPHPRSVTLQSLGLAADAVDDSGP